MVDLESAKGNQIEDYMNKSDDEYNNGNYIKSIELLEKAWEELPEPKGIYDDSFFIVKYISETCLLCEDISKAKKWSEILFSCDLERIDSGERDFVAGKVAFAEDDLERARNFFAIANEKSEGRCFEGEEDPKYLIFFRNEKA